MANQPRKVETDTLPPAAGKTPCVREGTSPEATPVPPCQPQKPRPSSREKRGGEPEAPCRETSCSKQKGKLPGEQPASQPSEENPARHRAGERQHPPGRRSRPNPRQGEKKKGQDPLRLEYHKHRTRQKRGP